MNDNRQWFKEAPKEAGYYWFHGTSEFQRNHNRTAETILVKVAKNTNNIFYVTSGTFMFIADEKWHGFWMKVEVPIPSKELLDTL